jgi:two-component system, NarL family, response regulator
MKVFQKIRLLLVDDHPVLRAGLSNLLGLEPDIEVVGEADGGAAAIAMWSRVKPHVGLVDLSMEGVDGIETTRLIHKEAPQAKIVMLTSSESADDAARALAAGVAAYVTKTVDHEEIVATIREVHAGASNLRKGVRGAARSPDGMLSPREMDVLVQLRKGSTNAEIGAALGISERTVKWHVKAMLAKLHTSDRAGLVARGFDLGLLKATRPTD